MARYHVIFDGAIISQLDSKDEADAALEAAIEHSAFGSEGAERAKELKIATVLDTEAPSEEEALVEEVHHEEEAPAHA